MNEKGHTEALEKMERKFFDEKVNPKPEVFVFLIFFLLINSLVGRF